MSDEYRKLGHPTRPRVPRVDNEEDRESQRDAVTKVECPVCRGLGCVPADVAVAIDLALAMRKDEE